MYEEFHQALIKICEEYYQNVKKVHVFEEFLQAEINVYEEYYQAVIKVCEEFVQALIKCMKSSTKLL